MDAHRRYLTAAEIAFMIGRSPRTIRRWLAAHVIPSFHIGGTRLVDAQDLEAVIARSKSQPR